MSNEDHTIEPIERNPRLYAASMALQPLVAAASPEMRKNVEALVNSAVELGDALLARLERK